MTNLVSKHCHSAGVAYREGMRGMASPKGTVNPQLQRVLAPRNMERERNLQAASGQLHAAHLELILKGLIVI